MSTQAATAWPGPWDMGTWGDRAGAGGTGWAPSYWLGQKVAPPEGLWLRPWDCQWDGRDQLVRKGVPCPQRGSIVRMHVRTHSHTHTCVCDTYTESILVPVVSDMSRTPTPTWTHGHTDTRTYAHTQGTRRYNPHGP